MVGWGNCTLVPNLKHCCPSDALVMVEVILLQSVGLFVELAAVQSK